MILPLPTAAPSSKATTGDAIERSEPEVLRFIDLSHYQDFFADVQSGYPKLKPLLPNLLPNARVDAAAAGTIEVHEVGDFIASFVPTVDAFDRLDPQFVIPKETWSKIPSYSGYGFAVFQLKSLSGQPHPMAMEFTTALDSQVFFPTLHIHDGLIHERESFDHELYLQHGSYDSVVGHYRGPNSIDPSTGFVRSRDTAKHFVDIPKSGELILPDLLIHRKKMRGNLPNRDQIVQATGNPLTASFNWNPVLRCWPLAAAGTGLAWIISRRKRLANQQR